LGFVIDRIFRPAHIVNHANIIDKPYMTTANLPMRYEIFNSGTASEIAILKQICATVISNGGWDQEIAYTHSVQNVAIKEDIETAYTSLIGIRPKALFNGITNRGQILPLRADVTNTGADTLLWALFYNPTVNGSPTYVSVGSNSITEYDTVGTTVTGGEIIDSGQIVSSRQSKNSLNISVGLKYPLSLDIAGSNPKTLVLAVRSITGQIDALGSILFAENY
jgi:hypothetical protein